ncbi:MAG: CSLREA domain-containing protein [Chloroflexi bacterium]|nr:CSLREA domain-containing protein [Chloroflexota bacterium]
MKPRTKWVFLLFFGMILLLFSSCTPTPYCVPIYDVTKTNDTDDGVCSPRDCSLREAVDNANACPGSQTINLPAGGYTLTLDGDDENLNKTGDLDVTDDLVLIGTAAPSINGNIERAFHIHSGVTATFEGIWLTDGDAIYGGGLVNEGFLTLNNFTCNYNNVSIPPGGMGDAMGGCIFNTGVAHINNGHFLANTAGYGGAIYNLGVGAVEVVDSSLTGNEAEFLGGAVWNDVDADMHLYTITLDQNQAGLHGGAVWSHGTVNLEGSILEDNQAGGNGGGIYLWEGFGTVENSWLTRNTAGLGGGFYNEDGMVHFYQSGVTANSATSGLGGGIYNNGLTPSNGLLMYNTTVSGNSAVGGGGGIYNTGQFDLRFITIADNNPEGIRIDSGLEIKLRSSALSNNSGGDCAGMTPDSLDYNIVSDGSCALIGGHDLLGVDPLLEPLAAHGSVAPSHALGLGSPALDSGVPDLCTAIDQNGTTRPQGPWCDRGAHENLSAMGTVRGWTYIDANRNDQRDPIDGAISGMILTLKEGPCPGGADIEVVETGGHDGFYEILDIEPGDYCLARSLLQQTIYPDYHDLTFAPGDILEDVNSRYLLSLLGDSSLHGLVWQDECAVPYVTPSSPPPGCIWLPGNGGLGADGIYDPSESGIAGVILELYKGGCPPPEMAISGTVETDSNGEFSLSEFTAGTWCVTTDALVPPNNAILIPGNWTYPIRGAAPAEFEVVVGAGENLGDVNFGWDYQFLPVAEESANNFCILNRNAFLRIGPSSLDYPTVTAFEKDHLFEVLAVSGPDRPGWYYGMDEMGFDGWIAQYLLDCKTLDLSKLEIRKSPPVPIKTPTSIICNSDLPADQCTAAGGTMSTTTTTAPHCICP